MHNCISLSHSSCGTQWSYYLQIQVDKQGQSHLVMPELYFLKSVIHFLCQKYLRCFLIPTSVCQSTVKPLVPECVHVILWFYWVLRVNPATARSQFLDSQTSEFMAQRNWRLVLTSGVKPFASETPHLTHWFTCICSGMLPRAGSGAAVRMFFPPLPLLARNKEAECKLQSSGTGSSRCSASPRPTALCGAVHRSRASLSIFPPLLWLRLEGVLPAASRNKECTSLGAAGPGLQHLFIPADE